LEQWAPILREEHGISLEFCAFESPRLTEVIYTHGNVLQKGTLMLRDFLRRGAAVRLAGRYDAAVVYREVATLGPSFWERILARLDVPFLFDFDDAIWMNATHGARTVNGVFQRLRFPGKTATIAKLARVVTVGNRFLADWTRQFNAAVHVVTTSIDIHQYAVQPELPAEATFTLGWMGSHSTLANLEIVRDAVERFGAKQRTKLLVVCDVPLERPFRNVENVFVRWSAAREAADIGEMHVGLMPLGDDAFARGKCGCKALQYMAAGRPCIVSPVGVNSEIVRHGQNGMVASTTAEWLAAFEAMAGSGELRERLASEGRRSVEQAFSAGSAAAKFAEALRETAGERALERSA